MMPMQPGPEDFARQLSDRSAEMARARALVHAAHSRAGVMARFLQRMADALDPTGESRRRLR
jgi:hypothetical protein